MTICHGEAWDPMIYICHEIYTGRQASFGRCAIIFYSEFYKQLSLTQTLHSLRPSTSYNLQAN